MISSLSWWLNKVSTHMLKLYNKTKKFLSKCLNKSHSHSLSSFFKKIWAIVVKCLATSKCLYSVKCVQTVLVVWFLTTERSVSKFREKPSFATARSIAVFHTEVKATVAGIEMICCQLNLLPKKNFRVKNRVGQSGLSFLLTDQRRSGSLVR